MGYYVRLLPKRQSLPHWKIQFISQKKGLIRPGAKGPTTT